MKIVKRIEIVVMNSGGWNAVVPGGMWATAETPEEALERLLEGIAVNPKYGLAVDNRMEQGNDA